ncbi:cytochrome b5-like Heme/Steroid binding domain protein [Oesophagostomum dentatum]|uniref:Cytochrome b5-like Heme/Steroid binding domain protein n=1 Tax=Oesophagostomum dentatum TaxID=61180 RepID=A0A0B1SCM9_OESDE|nr:cytochrome b5-like Heme/Steroid binding domain protein [Oesophagostomum dentatum]
MTLEELRKYDGVQDEHILFALNGTIYDVSRGHTFYGPGGPYGALAGRDATRALGTMNVKDVKDEWDDHEDMPNDQKETADEWEASFKYKYPTVGKLIKDGAARADYGGAMSAIPA